MSQIESFACPHCDRQYRYKPEFDGKRIRCKCGEKFAVEPPVDEPEQYAIDDQPPEDDGPDWSALLGPEGAAPPPVDLATQPCPGCGAAVKPGAVICIHCGTDLKSGKKRGKTKITRAKDTAHETAASAVRTKVAGVGLLIHGLGYLGMIGAVVLFFVGGWQAGSQSASADTMLAIAGITFLVAIPMLILGPFLCLAVPKEAGLLFLIGAIGLYIVGVACLFAVGTDMIPPYLSSVAMLPQVFAAGCFVGFMMKMAEYINAGAVYENSEFLLKTWKYIAITSVLLVLPFVGCIAVLVFLIAQTIFTLTYGWIVCQAGVAAIRS